MLLVEAIEAVKSSWNEGESCIGSVAGKLSDSSRLEVILVDVEQEISYRQEFSINSYLERYPEFDAYRNSIEKHVAQLAKKREVVETAESQDLFSKASYHLTLDHDSKVIEDSKISQSSNTKSPSSETKSIPGWIPASIGNYRPIKVLGEGSFGLVLLAEDTHTGRLVAIKIQDPKKSEKGLSDAFLHEARAISRLDHPGIVRLLHVDETTDGLGYLVYEYVAGTTLFDRVKMTNYSVDTAVEWIASVADALDFAHRCGVVHRDLSPRNIMISENGGARLLDFGLSRIDGQFPVPDQDRILGTPHFMSPEQASGKPHWATSYADLFSLGSVLYFVLTEKLPFPGTSIFDILERVQFSHPASPRSIRHGISLELEEVIAKSMSKEPQARYSTGGDFALALKKAIAKPKLEPRDDKSKSTAPMATIILATLMLVAGAAFLTLAWIHSNARIDSVKENISEKEESPGVDLKLIQVSIKIEREGIDDDRSLMEGNWKKTFLPFSARDRFVFNWWVTDSVKTSQYKSTILVIGKDPKATDIILPQTTTKQIAAGELPREVLLVIVCISRSPIDSENLRDLPTPWKNKIPAESVTTSNFMHFNAPKIQEELNKLPDVKLRSGDIEIADEFHEYLQKRLEVQSYVGVVFDMRNLN